VGVAHVDDVTWDLETDLVVIGGGGCGLVTALAAARQGVQVLLLEKANELGGNTAMSAGFIPAAGTSLQRQQGIEDSPEILARDIFQKNGYTSDPAITRLLAHKTAEVVEWMMDELGVVLELVTEVRWDSYTTDRTHGPPSRSGAELVHYLHEAAKRESNIALATNSPVRDLVVDDTGAVVGAIAETIGREAVRCQKVMLACNGFAGNPEMVAQYIPEMKQALYFGAEGNTGDGIRWGMELGAATDHMTAYQGHGSIAYPASVLLTWRVIAKGGVMVNRHGRRFADESIGYSAFAREVVEQPEQLGFHVFGEQSYRPFIEYKDFRDCIELGIIKQGATLPELAHHFNIDANNLVATIEAYNRAVVHGGDEFGRTKYLARLAPPFYGAQVTGALFHTQGGLRVNTNAQVVRPDGQPIPNLYAGGGAAVGVSGPSPEGYNPGNGLTAALGLGKVAGDHIAAVLKEGH
jgi:fumarate reductase flavoprotein subunit